MEFVENRLRSRLDQGTKGPRDQGCKLHTPLWTRLLSAFTCCWRSAPSHYWQGDYFCQSYMDISISWSVWRFGGLPCRSGSRWGMISLLMISTSLDLTRRLLSIGGAEHLWTQCKKLVIRIWYRYPGTNQWRSHGRGICGNFYCTSNTKSKFSVALSSSQKSLFEPAFSLDVLSTCCQGLMYCKVNPFFKMIVNEYVKLS